MRLIPLLDAQKLAEKNKAALKDLLARQAAATKTAKAAERKLNNAYKSAFDVYLLPFAEQFARIRNVELGDLPVVDSVPETQKIDLKLQAVAINTVQSLAALAGGGAAGLAAGGLTFAAVGALATASTGAAISGLSGAAATSAILAWLGGGSVAAGGGGVAAGGMVLAGTIAAPVVIAVAGILWWQGEKAYNKQRETQQELRQAASKLSVHVAKSKRAVRRADATATVVTRLVDIGAARISGLRLVLDRTQDYGAFIPSERAHLAELVGIATTVASVIACPILDNKGQVSTLAVKTAGVAEALADRLAA